MEKLAAKVSDILMLPQVLTGLLERAANKALSLSGSQDSLSELEQKTLILLLSELSFPLSFTIADKKIICSTQTETSDCQITTSLASLRQLKAEQQITTLIKQDKLDVSGDIKIAQQFASVIDSLNIDWQSELAKHIGDIPTHKLSQFGNKVSGKFAKISASMQADISEYLVHEHRLVVTQGQIHRFQQGVQDVAREADTLTQRIKQLSEKISNT